MAMSFHLDNWLINVEFPNEIARSAVGDWLRRIDCTTGGSLRGLNLDVDAPADFPLGWTAALRTAIATLQSEAGMHYHFYVCIIEFSFLFLTPFLTTIHRLFLSHPVAHILSITAQFHATQ